RVSAEQFGVKENAITKENNAYLHTCPRLISDQLSLLVVRQRRVNLNILTAQQRKSVAKDDVVRTCIRRKVDIDTSGSHLPAVIERLCRMSILPIKELLLGDNEYLDVVSAAPISCKATLKVNASSPL